HRRGPQPPAPYQADRLPIMTNADQVRSKVLLRRGFFLEYATLAWNVAGILILIIAAWTRPRWWAWWTTYLPRRAGVRRAATGATNVDVQTCAVRAEHPHLLMCGKDRLRDAASRRVPVWLMGAA